MPMKITATYVLTATTIAPDLATLPDALKALAADMEEVGEIAPHFLVAGEVFSSTTNYKIEREDQ